MRYPHLRHYRDGGRHSAGGRNLVAQPSPGAPPDLEPRAPALRLNGVRLHYGDLTALDGVDLRVERGEFVALVGPSGCGKTSLLRIAAGLQPAAGSIEVLGGPPLAAQAAKRLGLVPQTPALLPWRDVRANIALPRQVNRATGGPDDAAGIEALIALVGLEGFAGARPHELSGGMQQRVALARALAIDPDLLLMDEPFAALDEITRESMRYELLRIWAGAGDGPRKSVLFVTHSIAEAVAMADRVLVMTPRPGRILAALPIDLPRPRHPGDEAAPVFLHAVARIRSLLRDATPAGAQP